MTNEKLIELQTKSTATFSAKVLADSVNPCGDRLTTFELTYPRVIHSEIMTHRLFSRNAASSRAIPVERLLKAIQDHPFIPQHWGVNQTGMQAYSQLEGDDLLMAASAWLSARDTAMYRAEQMRDAGLHKQIANRILEPWMFITVVLSTTSFRHFELLRDHPMAEPHFQYLAKLMVSARSQSLPEALKPGEWHLPLVFDEDRSRLNLGDLKKVSVARCARVSYVRQNSDTSYEEDFKLYARLVGSDPKHASPTEHQATPHCKIVDGRGDNGECLSDLTSLPSANFQGWKQHRQEIVGEFVPDEPYVGEVW